MSEQSFSLDLNLHHPSCDCSHPTQELALQPWFARNKGDVLAGIEHKATSWLCHFRKGIGNDEFDQALKAVVSFLSDHGPFFQSFVEGHGTAQLVVNANTPFIDGKLLELSLDPLFLSALSKAGVELKIQVWKA